MHLSIGRLATIALLTLTSCLVDASPQYRNLSHTDPHYKIASAGFKATSLTTVHTTATSSSSRHSSTATSSQGIDDHFNPSQPPLNPALHPTHQAHKVENLAPAKQQSLYFSSNAASDSSSAHTFAEISFNATHPCVVLLHSQYVDSITYSNEALDIEMSDKSALAYVQSTWPMSSPIVVAALMGSEGQPAEQHTFWLVTSVRVDYSKACVHMVVQQELPIEEAMPEVEIVWGTYQPNKGTSSPPKGPSTGNGQSPSHNETCGLPPYPLIDGFHTAPCGSPTFDMEIDREIGYLDFDAEHWSDSLAHFAPGLDGKDYSVENNQDFGAVEPEQRARRRRRGFFSSIVDGARSIGNAVGNAVVNAGKAVVQGATDVAGKVTSAVSDALAVTPTANADIPINVGPSGLVSSPFGVAKQLFARDAMSKKTGAIGHVAVYCVQCGVNGILRLTGSARYTIKDGLQQANAGLSGNLAAGVQLGIDASAEISQNSDFPLISVAVPPGFSVPRVFAIGPMVTLNAELNLDISLSGQVLAGVMMNIPNFSANLDLVNPSQSSTSGFTPQFQKIFQAQAAVSVTAGLALPVGVGLGISVPPLNLQKTAAVYDKPSVSATIVYTGNSDGGGGGDCVNGISYDLQFENDVYADIFGLATVNILQFNRPLGSDCILLGGPNNSGGSGDDTGDTSDGSDDGNGDGSDDGNDGGSDDGNDDGSNDGNDDGSDDGNDDDGTNEKRSVSGHSQPSKSRLSIRADSSTSIDIDNRDSGANNTQFQILSDQALKVANSETKPSNREPGFVDDPDISWVYINDQSRTWSLTADPATGNVYVAQGGQGSLFATKQGYVIGDVSGSCFHYYPDLMERYGVSRLRFADEDKIPKDANYVGLIAVSIDEKEEDKGARNGTASQSAYTAFDSNGNIFLLATCNIQGQHSKMFLVKDAKHGAKMLKDEMLRWTVTGGIVEDCYYLLWDAAAL